MLGEIWRPKQLITAKLGDSSEIRDRNHRLREVYLIHAKFLSISVCGIFYFPWHREQRERTDGF